MQLQLKSGSLFDRTSCLQAVATSALATDEPLRLDYAPGKLESQARLRGRAVERVSHAGSMIAHRTFCPAFELPAVRLCLSDVR